MKVVLKIKEADMLRALLEIALTVIIVGGIGSILIGVVLTAALAVVSR